MTTDITSMATNLELSDSGVWFAKDRSPVSYPEDGAAKCLAIDEESFWFNHRNRCILEVMRRFPPGGTMFDIGGGNGYVSLALTRAGFDTVVVEPSLEGAINARSRGLSLVICATLDDAGFRAGTISAAGLFDVVEHIEDDVGFLSRLRELMIPSGRVYGTVPAYEILFSCDDEVAGHYRRYTCTTLTETMRSAGLEVEFATYLFGALPLPVFLLRTLPSRLGLREPEAVSGDLEGHHAPSGFAANMLQRALNWEYSRLQDGGILGFGGSCLVVARAPR